MPACLDNRRDWEERKGNGMNLYTYTAGAGTPLLMIHGIISDGSFFDEAASFLSDEYQVISYDRRGYGRSTLETYTDFSVGAQAEDAADVLRACTDQKALLFGNSAGSLIALELAFRHPEMVRGMVLLEPSLAWDEEERGKLREWNRELNEYRASGRIKRAMPAFIRVTGAPASGESAGLAEMKKTYSNLKNFMFGELNEVQRAYDPSLERCRNLEIPVKVAVTREGAASIFATSSVSGARLAGWEIVEFPGYHNTAKDMPEDFAKALKRALNGL